MIREPQKIEGSYSFPLPFQLEACEFLERPNRFLLICRKKGERIEVHLPDPGRLKELLLPGTEVYVRPESNPGRRTRWSAVMVKHGDILVSVNSTLPNMFFGSALKAGAVPGFDDTVLIRAEHSIGRHRYDFSAERNGRPCLIEVKGVSLVEKGRALFPDAVTERGRSHVLHLADMDDGSIDRHIVFIIQRPDAKTFSPHWERDPKFSEALLYAHNKGLNIHAYSIRTSLHEWRWHSLIPVILEEAS